MRAKLNAWVASSPILVVLVLMVVQMVPGGVAKTLFYVEGNYWTLLPAELATGAVAALVITLLGWWRETGFFGPIRWRSLWVLAVPLAAAATNYAGVGVAGWEIVAIAVVCLMIGFEEEAWTRGILLRILVPRFGAMGGAAVMAAFFGAGHLVHLFFGAPVVPVLVQVLMAAAIGWSYAAIRLRTNSIWPVILLHAVFDFAVAIGGSIDREESLASLLIMLAALLLMTVNGYFAIRGLDGNGEPKAA